MEKITKRPAGLPKYKKKCVTCGKFAFIKSGWNQCLECHERAYGPYEGEDRDKLVNG